MDPIALLEKDHRVVDELFKKIEETSDDDPAMLQVIFNEVKKELDIHALIEETYFYPATRRKDKTEEETEHAYDEHDEMKALLKKLDAMEKDDPEWRSTFDELAADTRHHVEEEETELFPDARKVLSEEKLNEIGEKMHELKMKEEEKRS